MRKEDARQAPLHAEAFHNALEQERSNFDLVQLDQRARMSRRRVISAGVMAAGVGLVGGCVGSFPLFSLVHGWVRHFESKWVSWLLFLVFAIILPAYWLMMFCDVLVVNAIEFWSGNNPVPNKYASFLTRNGGELVLEKTEDPTTLRVAVLQHGEVKHEAYIQRLNDDHFRLYDAELKLVAEAHGARGGAKIVNAARRELVTIDHAKAQRIKRAVAKGASPAEELMAVIELDVQDEALASLRTDSNFNV